MQNLVLYSLCVLIWGSTWYAIKFQLTDIDPLLSVAYRFGGAAIVLAMVLAAMGRLRKINYTPRQYFFIALQGFSLFFLGYWLFYLTTGYLTSGLVAVVFSTLVVMNTFNQAIFFRTPVKPQVILATLFGLAGIVSVFWPEVQTISIHDETFRGILIGLVATYASSVGQVISGRNSRDGIPVLESTMISMAIGSAIGVAVALAGGAELAFNTSPGYLLSLGYLSLFGSVIAFVSYLTLLARIGADRASYAAVLFPIVALAISTVYEDYHWTPAAFMGVGLVLIGNVLVLTNPEKFRRALNLVRKESGAGSRA